MARVFINFRNGDDPYAAALISMALGVRFGRQAVFRSNDSIAVGDDWASEIWRNLRESDVFVPVIGKRWLDVADGRGRRRLPQRHDWVRAEIATALRLNKHIIPVLLRDVPRLQPQDLPRSIRGLAGYQSITMDHSAIDTGIGRIIAEIARTLPALEEVAPADSTGPDRTRPADDWLRIWNVPARNPYFVERHAPMTSIRNVLDRDSDVRGADVGEHRTLVIHGGVGVGKTQLAIEFAHRYAGQYQSVWWVSGESSEPMSTQLARLARAVGFEAGADIDAALPALGTELRRAGRWLLVFDNVDGPDQVRDHLARIGPSADVLITSRDPNWGQLPVAHCKLGHFERTQSTKLLATLLPGVGDADLHRLASTVEDIPLALAQAATLLAQTSMAVGEYVESIATRARDVLHRGQTYVYPRSLAAAWSVGIDRLRTDMPIAAEILELLSFFGAAPVPFGIFRADGSSLPPSLAGLAKDAIRLADAEQAIARSGLVRVDPAGASLPGLFQTFIRDAIDHHRQAALRESARRALAALPRDDPRRDGADERYRILLPHVFALDLDASPDRACHRLLLDAVHFLVVRADAGTARDLAEAARLRWIAEHGADDESTLAATSHLAQALFRLGQYAQALALDEQVLAQRRLAHGGASIGAGDDREAQARLLTAAHNVAVDRWAAITTLVATGARAGEASFAEVADVAASRARLLGADHPDTLRSMHNVAAVERGRGDFRRAREIDQATLQRLRGQLGHDHPDTLRSAHALALDLHALGEAQPARDLDHDTYQRRCRVFGPDHPDTLRSAHGYAVGLRATGDLTGARSVAEDTYERRRHVLGAEHIDALESEALLGAIRFALGDEVGGGQLLRAAAVRLAALRAQSPAALP